MELIPGTDYYLKWVGDNYKNVIILECKFIKYRDNSIYEYYKEYKDNIDPYTRLPIDELESFDRFNELHSMLVDKVFDQNNRIIERNFQDPMYPYYFNYVKSRLNSNNIGLFKLVKIIKMIVQGNPNRVFNDYNLLNFSSFSLNVTLNTEFKLIPETTLLWVDLNNVKIIKGNIKQRMIHNKTLISLEGKLPQDVTYQIGEFVDSQEYLNRKRGGSKKSKKRKKKLFYKNKSKRLD